MRSTNDLYTMNNIVVVVKLFPTVPIIPEKSDSDVSYVGAQRTKMTWPYTSLDTYDAKRHLKYQEALNEWAHCLLPLPIALYLHVRLSLGKVFCKLGGKAVVASCEAL